MNAAAHGMDIDVRAADEARNIGTVFLAELKRTVTDK
jgi:hypothetical protein